MTLKICLCLSVAVHPRLLRHIPYHPQSLQLLKAVRCKCSVFSVLFLIGQPNPQLHASLRLVRGRRKCPVTNNIVLQQRKKMLPALPAQNFWLPNHAQGL